jgi:hypothetical protein
MTEAKTKFVVPEESKANCNHKETYHDFMGMDEYDADGIELGYFTDVCVSCGACLPCECKDQKPTDICSSNCGNKCNCEKPVAKPIGEFPPVKPDTYCGHGKVSEHHPAKTDEEIERLYKECQITFKQALVIVRQAEREVQRKVRMDMLKECCCVVCNKPDNWLVIHPSCRVKEYGDAFEKGKQSARVFNCRCSRGDTAEKICECYQAGREEALKDCQDSHNDMLDTLQAKDNRIAELEAENDIGRQSNDIGRQSNKALNKQLATLTADNKRLEKEWKEADFWAWAWEETAKMGKAERQAGREEEQQKALYSILCNCDYVDNGCRENGRFSLNFCEKHFETAKQFRSRIAELEAVLATKGNVVNIATQEQIEHERKLTDKIASLEAERDELHGQNSSLVEDIQKCGANNTGLREQLATFTTVLKRIEDKDKTPNYPYVGNTKGAHYWKDNKGVAPPKGSCWLTPREIARQALKEAGDLK